MLNVTQSPVVHAELMKHGSPNILLDCLHHA